MSVSTSKIVSFGVDILKYSFIYIITIINFYELRVTVKAKNVESREFEFLRVQIGIESQSRQKILSQGNF